MIEIMSIREMERRRFEFDEAWAIVRSMKNPVQGVEQKAALSPSGSLLGKYLDLKKTGNWNYNTFQTVYVPTFLQEIKSSREAKDLLNALVKAERQNKHVALGCFCSDERLCHRSIIAGLLQGVGCTVRAQHDYSDFWSQYQAI